MSRRSTVTIFNQALAWLGGEQLSQVETTWEQSTLGSLCRNNFSPILTKALATHNWSFALKRVQLAAKPVDLPRPGWPHRYGLPPDLLRPVGLFTAGGEGAPFLLEGGDIWAAATPATLLYVALVEDPAAWSAPFSLALSWGLAAALATARNNDQRKQTQCLQNYEVALQEAVAFDLACQKTGAPASSWRRARLGG